VPRQGAANRHPPMLSGCDMQPTRWPRVAQGRMAAELRKRHPDGEAMQPGGCFERQGGDGREHSREQTRVVCFLRRLETTHLEAVMVDPRRSYDPRNSPTLPPSARVSVTRFKCGAPVDELAYRLSVGDHEGALDAAQTLFDMGSIPVLEMPPQALGTGF